MQSENMKTNTYKNSKKLRKKILIEFENRKKSQMRIDKFNEDLKEICKKKLIEIESLEKAQMRLDQLTEEMIESIKMDFNHLGKGIDKLGNSANKLLNEAISNGMIKV